MTLTLLVGPDPGRDAVIFADPAGDALEPVLAGLIGGLGDVRRLVFPLPDETTRRHLTPPPLLRSRHADLWHGLSADERSRVVLAAGESAAYLAPLADTATTIVAVREPAMTSMPPGGASRAVLGPFAELDEVPEEPGSDAERDDWIERVGAATDRFRLVRPGDHAALAAAVAVELGFGPQRAARVGRVAASSGAAAGSGRRDRPVHWLDQALYELSAEPEQPPPRKRRRA
jgi:hypothetical protein